jgi:hypothetical protein
MKIKWWIAGYLIVLAVAMLAPLASASPDGLERVAQDQQFSILAEESRYQVIPGYALPGVANDAVGTILAGFIGVTVIFLLVGGGAYLTQRMKAG